MAIIAFIFAGSSFIKPEHWHPYYPNGWSGVLTGGSIIFFTYIGFDSVSTAAEECRRPQRDIPIGIIATLIICTVLYVAVAVVLTGLVPWQSMVDDAAPVVNALKKLSRAARRPQPALGAAGGALRRDAGHDLLDPGLPDWASRGCGSPCRGTGCCRHWFGQVHPRFRTPAVATWVAGFVVGIPGGLLDIGTLADLSNIGTLFAFVLVSIGVHHPAHIAIPAASAALPCSRRPDYSGR